MERKYGKFVEEEDENEIDQSRGESHNAAPMTFNDDTTGSEMHKNTPENYRKLRELELSDSIIVKDRENDLVAHFDKSLSKTLVYNL
jgi:hypothetical protein